MANTPKPPADLRRSGRALWRAVVGGFELEAHERHILGEACRTADLVAALAAVVDAEGVTDPGAKGVRAHPLLAELRQQRLVLARLVAVLRIPLDEDASEGRTQYRGIRGVYTFRDAS